MSRHYNARKLGDMKDKVVTVSDRYYKPEEVAELLQVSRQTVYNWINEGRLQAVKAGRTTRVAREALADFLKPYEPGVDSAVDDSA